MIDEKKLIEAIKERQKIHNKDVEDFRDNDPDLDDDFDYLLLARVDELDVILKTIDELPKVDAADINVGSKWIPVEEYLPETNYETVLVITDENYYCVAVYTKQHGFRTEDIGIEGKIIAWMPLPEPYEGNYNETSIK